MEKPFLEIGYYKGEMDFGVNCSIQDLTLEEFNEFRKMVVVAIGQAEAMYSRANAPQASSSSLEL